MRPISDAEIEKYLEAAGEAVTTSVGAYQLEGLGRASVRANRGRSLHDTRIAVAAASGMPAQRQVWSV